MFGNPDMCCVQKGKSGQSKSFRGGRKSIWKTTQIAEQIIGVIKKMYKTLIGA